MRLKKYEFDEKKIARRQAEGRGIGSKSTYEPWLKVRDVPSHGRRHRTVSEDGGRVVHLMSDVENNLFLMIGSAEVVADIREQFPLDRQETYRIACEMGIRHPTNRDGHPGVMTTDLLVVLTTTKGNVVLARAVKYDLKLNKRTLEKLEIERRYWKKKGVDWQLLTRADVDTTLIKNIKSVRSYRDLSGVPEPYKGCFSEISNFVLLTRDKPADLRVCDWCDGIDESFRTPTGTTLIVFKHLIAIKRVRMDMTISDQLEHRPLCGFTFITDK